MIPSEELIYLLQSTVIQAVIYTLLAVLVIYFAFSMYLRLRRVTYEMDINRSKIGALRTSKEGRIYDLVDEMTASDERWSEINHIALDSAQSLQKTSELISNRNFSETISTSRFLSQMGIKEDSIEVVPNSIFYLTPFHENFLTTYLAVRDAAKDIGLVLSRGDEDYAPGSITRHIIKQLLQAHFVVANLDGRNPNVFYELGVANAIGKPVILIAHRDTETPFDVSVDRTLFWSDIDELKRDFIRILAKMAIEQKASK